MLVNATGRLVDFKLLSYRLCAWLRFHMSAWNTGGNGVHSPYLFEWVRMVMSDKHSYYGWQPIEECRAAMLQDGRLLRFVDYGSGRNKNRDSDERYVKDIAKTSLSDRRYAQMLYRLVNWLGGQQQGVENKSDGLMIVELGTSLGVTTAYLASVNRMNKVVTYEGCEAVADLARQNWKELGLENIVCRVGEISVEVLDQELQSVDVAFIDANHTRESTLEYFNVLANKMHKKSVIVIDDIHYCREMEEAWQEICEDSRVSTTMDLFQMGLVFFDTNYWHKNYKIRL